MKKSSLSLVENRYFRNIEAASIQNVIAETASELAEYHQSSALETYNADSKLRSRVEAVAWVENRKGVFK